LNCSLNIVRLIKRGKKRWTAHVARIEGMINSDKTLIGRPDVVETTWKT